MHKGVILLVEAEDSSAAIDKVKEFMEQHGKGSIWDWFVIGGRWSGQLNEKSAEFLKIVKTELPPDMKPWEEGEDGMYSDEYVKENKPKLQSLWESIGGIGTNPWSRDGYKPVGYFDDVMPLSECLETVKEYAGDSRNLAEEYYRHAEKAMKENNEHMRGYYLRKAEQLLSQRFCFHCNLYNVAEHDYSIPKETEGIWAAMIDMHN